MRRAMKHVTVKMYQYILMEIIIPLHHQDTRENTGETIIPFGIFK